MGVGEGSGVFDGDGDSIMRPGNWLGNGDGVGSSFSLLAKGFLNKMPSDEKTRESLRLR